MDRKIFSAGIPISSLPVGTKIKIRENGTLVNYIVVSQGEPSHSLYGYYCDGTWLLRESIYETRQWHSSNSNSYSSSTIHSYLNNTFLMLFDSGTQSAIRRVRIPYRTGVSGNNIASGSSGLQCKIFLLSAKEIGATQVILPSDGYRLSYFPSGETSSERIAYLDSIKTAWWLRSVYTDGQTYAWFVNNTDGRPVNGLCSTTYGVRPALVLDFDTNVLSTPDTDGAYILDA